MTVTTNTLTDATLNWLEHTDEVFYQHVLPMIAKMPMETQTLLFDQLDDAADRHSKGALGGDALEVQAIRIKDGVEMFVHGWFKKIPCQWRLRAGQLKRERDTEHVEYIRLRQKFEGSP